MIIISFIEFVHIIFLSPLLRRTTGPFYLKFAARDTMKEQKWSEKNMQIN